MKKIDELRKEIYDNIEDIQDFIKAANEKLEKYTCLISAIYVSCDNIAGVRGKITELASEICRISSLIDEAMEDLEEYKTQLTWLDVIEKSYKG